MRTQTFLFLIALCFPVILNAQDDKRAASMRSVEEKVKSYQKVVKLSPEQSERMTRLYMAADKELANKLEEHDRIQAEIMKIRERYDSQAQELLTKEQRAMLLEMRRSGKVDEVATCVGACCPTTDKEVHKEESPSPAVQPATPSQPIPPAQKR